MMMYEVWGHAFEGDEWFFDHPILYTLDNISTTMGCVLVENDSREGRGEDDIAPKVKRDECSRDGCTQQ